MLGFEEQLLANGIIIPLNAYVKFPAQFIRRYLVNDFISPRYLSKLVFLVFKI